MIEGTTTPLLDRAVRSHLSGLQGLRGVQAFIGQAGDWTEASCRGAVPPDIHRRVLASFDPDAGGAVEALEGKGGWLATYMLGGPGLDLVLILVMDSLDPAELQARLPMIESKVGWLMVAALADRQAAGDSRAQGSEIGAQILLDAAQARTRRILADQWIARLETAFRPGLVCVQWVVNGTPKLVALSGGGLIERPSDARGDLEALAKIAIANRAPLLVSAETDQLSAKNADLVQAANDEPVAVGRTDRRDAAFGLVERLGARRALILPIYEREETAAVVELLFERDNDHGLRVEGAEVIATLLGEALAIQGRAHPRVFRRIGVWLLDLIRAIFGKTAWKLKFAVALIAMSLLVASVVPSNYRPSFTARVEAGDRRIVSAPFDGFLSDAAFELGDRVEAGSLLVALEDSEIRLTIAQLQAGLSQTEAELQAARAARDTAQVRLLEARREQSIAELALVHRQLELSRFEAPSDAIIVGGDAWRRIGDRVRLGEPLLELAAADSFRILAFVSEDWVAESVPGTEATALLTAYPDRSIPVRLADIGADPQTRDGTNTFPVWFEIIDPLDLKILDGMRGVVRLEIGERSVLEAYSRGIRRWLDRFLWRLGIGGGDGA
jgi:multidrug efflux pump subunit AcrA (membrane-fusion protein)